MFKKIKNRKGFTLIELIVVIAILAVLAAIIIPTVSNSIARAQQARDLANARSIYAREVIAVLNGAPTVPAVDGEFILTGPDSLECELTYDANTRVISTFTCTTGTPSRGTYALTNGEIVFTAP